MLHQETVTPETLVLIRKIFSDPNFRDFTLVGGTALSLQIGHRMSIDIDLFSQKDFNAQELANHIQQKYDVHMHHISRNSIRCEAEKVRMDLVTYQYDNINPPVVNEGIRMSSKEDTAAMTINAIVNRPDRLNDYIDIYYLLQHHSLRDLVNAYAQKYPGTIKERAVKSLLYHAEIDYSVPVKLLNNGVTDFTLVSKRLKDAAKYPEKVFTAEKLLARKKLNSQKRTVGDYLYRTKRR